MKWSKPEMISIADNKICAIEVGTFSCYSNEKGWGQLDLPVPFGGRPVGIYGLSTEVCALYDNDILRCWHNGFTKEITEFSGFKNARLFQINPTFGATSQPSVCLVDDEGVKCNDPKLNLPLPNGKIKDINLTGARNCLIDQDGLKCINLYADGEKAPTNILNPVGFISSYWDGTCVESDSGLSCWGGDKPPKEIQGLHIRDMFYDGQSGCALIDNHIRCWGRLAKIGYPKDLSHPSQIFLNQPDSDKKKPSVCVVDEGEIKCGEYPKYFPTFLDDVKQAQYGLESNCALDNFGITCWGKEIFQEGAYSIQTIW